MDLKDKLLFSKRETAYLLSLSIRTVDNLLIKKRLTAKHVGRRTLVTKASIEHFARIDAQPTIAETQGLEE